MKPLAVVKGLLILGFLWGIGWLLVTASIKNGREGIAFFSFLIGFGFFAAYYLGKESK